MKEMKCPFCGREVTRGKYCIFCGNPLRGAESKPAGNAAGARSGKEDGALWNPEKAYAQSRFKRILLFAVITVFAAAAAGIFIAQRRTDSRTGIFSGRSNPFSASCGIQPGMTLREMTACMEAFGFQALGDPYQHAAGSFQMFYGTTVWGETTEYSLAVLQDDGKGGEQRAVLHYLTEPEEKTWTFENRGPVFRNLLNALTRQYGTPAEERSSIPVISWQVEGGTLFLRYIVDSEIEIQYLLDESRKAEADRRETSAGRAAR